MESSLNKVRRGMVATAGYLLVVSKLANSKASDIRPLVASAERMLPSTILDRTVPTFMLAIETLSKDELERLSLDVDEDVRLLLDDPARFLRLRPAQQEAVRGMVNEIGSVPQGALSQLANSVNQRLRDCLAAPTPRIRVRLAELEASLLEKRDEFIGYEAMLS